MESLNRQQMLLKLIIYGFGAILGSLSLMASCSLYLALEKLIAFDNFSGISFKMTWSTVFDSFYF